MEFAYPFNLRKEGPEYIVTFPDIPEAITGTSDRGQAIELARDALLAALGAYIEDRRDIPTPSAKKPRQLIAYLRPLEAAKLGLYIAMREKQISNVQLGKLISMDEKAVRRMLDLDHPTKIEAISYALRSIFNYRLVTSMLKVSAAG